MAQLAQTEGTIVSAEMGSGQSRYKMQSGGYAYRTSFFPVITYQYTVNGQQFVSNTYARRPSMINRKFLIQRILDKYPSGSSVTVHYNPENPQEAYLQTGYGGMVTMIVLAFAVLAMIIIAIILLLVM